MSRPEVYTPVVRYPTGALSARKPAKAPTFDNLEAARLWLRIHRKADVAEGRAFVRRGARGINLHWVTP